jgi:hypothetical protein
VVNTAGEAQCALCASSSWLIDISLRSRSADDAPQILRELLPNPEQAEDPRTIAVRLMAVAKVFGRWAANVSSDWTTETRQLCLSLIEDVFQSLKLALASPELVVEERVSLAAMDCVQEPQLEHSIVIGFKSGPLVRSHP